ncbi:RDD family protein [bacterium]
MKKASFTDRLSALLLDIVLVIVPYNLFRIIVLQPYLSFFSEGDQITLFSPIIFLNFCLYFIYFVIMWTLSDGATVGKKIARIKIVDVNGNNISFGKAALRFLGMILSFVPVLLGFLWATWDKNKKAWHDYIAGTQVIETSKHV